MEFSPRAQTGVLAPAPSRGADAPAHVPDVPAAGVHAVLDRMRPVLDRLERSGDPRFAFLATYARTTAAVGEAIGAARFEDPQWVDRWDVAFAQLYLDALAAFEADSATAPRPWRAALGADPALSPLQLVLLGMNAHINYDLPQSLLAVITDDEFADPALMARRRRDHERIDTLLASRVAAEDALLKGAEQARGQRARSLIDRALTPLNRRATGQFLAESRRKVWQNTAVLQAARARGPRAYRATLAELELLTAAKIHDLLAPGQVLVKLAAGGFGVLLPPP